MAEPDDEMMGVGVADADVGADRIARPPVNAVSRTLMDPAATMAMVQEYVQAERRRSRGLLLWISSLFLFVAFLILCVFLATGMFVLKNSQKAVNIVSGLQRVSDENAADILTMSNWLSRVEGRNLTIQQALEHRMSGKNAERADLQRDLERFGRWVSSKQEGQNRILEEMNARMAELARELQDRDMQVSMLREQITKLSDGSVETGMALSAWNVPVVSTIPAESAGPTATEPSLVDPSPMRNDLPRVFAELPEDGKAPSLESMDAYLAMCLKEESELKTPSPTGTNLVTISFANGERYEGEIERDGRLEGWGRYIFTNGDVYEGGFRNDMRHGMGILKYANGNIYKGHFSAGKKDGRGMMTFKAGDRYMGSFANDLMDGLGALWYEGGNVYAGHFLGALRHGRGVLRFYNGDVYDGDFVGDARTGSGTYHFADGSWYKGEFENGRRHGIGQYVYATGEQYIGTFRAGKRHGKGVLVYPNGKRIEGMWENDEPQSVGPQ